MRQRTEAKTYANNVQDESGSGDFSSAIIKARGAMPPEIRDLGGQQNANRIRDPDRTSATANRATSRDAHAIRDRTHTTLTEARTSSGSMAVHGLYSFHRGSFNLDGLRGLGRSFRLHSLLLSLLVHRQQPTWPWPHRFHAHRGSSFGFRGLHRFPCWRIVTNLCGFWPP